MIQATPFPTASIGSLVLGRYRIMSTLATGGMGKVYLARAEGAAGFIKPVVIKRSLRSGGSVADLLFAREARILSRLRHPGIVGIVDFAEDQGSYIMVLEYVHGYTLSQWRRFRRKIRSPLPVPLAVHAILEVLDALEYAHTLCDDAGSPLGIVHRDIKPSNVLIDVDGRVKLADFGVARTHNEMTDANTGDATLKGTFAYMAPELFSRTEPSPRADVYSAAVAAYECIAGKNPFGARDVMRTAALTLKHTPPPLSELRSDVPSALAQAIAKGMCKHPEGRFHAAGELAAALRAALPLDQVDTLFRRAIAKDFSDPRFPELMELDSLAARQAAWSDAGHPGQLTGAARTAAARARASTPRGGSSEPFASVLAGPAQAQEADTAVLGRRPATGRPGEPAGDAADHAEPFPGPLGVPARPRRWFPLAAIGIALAGALAAVAVVGGHGRNKAPTVVMVRGDVTIDGVDGVDAPAPAARPDARDGALSGAAAAPAALGTADVPPSPPESARRTRRSDKRPTPSEAALSARFRARQPQIEACFERHPTPGGPALKVRFQIDAGGTVLQASLEPSAAADLPLGRCVLAVAGATRFGPQPEPVSFVIPLLRVAR